MKFRCRTCYNLTEENEGLDLFTEGTYITEQGQKSLAAMLLECTSVNVFEGGKFQHIRERKYIICRHCQLELIKLYTFRNQCIRVQNLFKNTKSNTDNTNDVGNHNHSAIFLIDTDEFKDEIVNCNSKENINCEDNKENFSENSIHDDNCLANEDDDDENCSDNNKDETEKINDRLKFCAKVSGMKEEEILSIIDSETPAIGEIVKKKQRMMPKDQIDNEEELDQEKKERYKNMKVYKRDSTNFSKTKTQSKDTVCYKFKTTLQENNELILSTLLKQKEEEVNKEISEYLSKKEKLFPTSTTECDVNK